MQELNGTLPGNASALNILLEEPMFGLWICGEGEQLPRSLECLLRLGDRLSGFPGIILPEVAKVFALLP